ncbi:flagellar biosynthesis protein FlhA [Fodinisporobacter ferrooxydans]|uniref:Flagellar biosynthesis protein FlhA n=1 Tax=Fodinisporobacter ferrooxydans TaxID=2901836 RepID=A0ABY4CFR8_9BACL|nr:flagellar biosynthesis protein FlhA [Alicyclobacillaceae bacterium MYW30-H2]
MKSRSAELTIILAVLSIISMMVIPIPTPLLDVLLIVNIGVSFMILLVAMNTTEALHFSVFPSLLLLTTLFRLALNVSSTRAILSTGNAGTVIHTFGSFVIGDNAVVGFVVFLILAIIQYLIITRGAERVAEVAARFTLDAMPGKQISIDADLNAGLINEKEARERRETIEKEADFFGAMDGAMKFVKGDAVASMIIVAINIIGGFIIGMAMNGDSLTTALQNYTILSVGDGLVSQLPALLISTSSGLIVTRSASGGTLGDELTRQLFSFPRFMYIVAGVLTLFGILTPIGPIRTLPVAALLAYGGYRMTQNLKTTEMQASKKEVAAEEAEVRSPESVMSFIQVDPIEFEFGYALIPLADSKQGGDLLDRVIMIRRQCALELGIVVPVIRIRDNIQLKPNQYSIKIRGNEVSNGELLLDHYLAMSPGIDDPAVTGIPTTEPAFGLPALWIHGNVRERAELAGYTVVDPPSVVATHLTEVIKRHAHELLGRQETKALVDSIKPTHPTLLDELIPGLLSIGDIQKVLGNLLREKVSIRDLVTILETLADYAAITKDHALLTEYVRQSLARQISQQYCVKGQVLPVITLSAAVEKRLADAIQHSEQGAYLALDPRVSQQVYHALNEQIGRLTTLGQQPVVITSPAVRLHFRRMIERVLPDVPVLSYNELDAAIEIQSSGMVSI